MDSTEWVKGCRAGGENDAHVSGLGAGCLAVPCPDRRYKRRSASPAFHSPGPGPVCSLSRTETGIPAADGE